MQQVTCPDLRFAFPDARPLKEWNGDTMLCDREHATGCGFISFREARTLYRVAQAFPGPWCEFGSHVGWSAAHLAAAGNQVWAVDPEYAQIASPIRSRAMQNLFRAKLLSRVRLIGKTSREFLDAPPAVKFAGVFIDGDHCHPAPLLDAQGSVELLAPRGVIVFHDTKGDPMRGVEWLRGQGFHTSVLETLNGMAVCWRGGERGEW